MGLLGFVVVVVGDWQDYRIDYRIFGCQEIELRHEDDCLPLKLVQL